MTQNPFHLISGKAALAGVIGWPVSHSLSPALHGYWLAKCGIDGAYVPLGLPPERFEEAVKAIPALGFKGFNVTIPYKERILPLLDRVDEAARRLGAVNTVTVTEGGALHGSNSDGFGFTEAVSEARPGWEKAVTRALLLGAGGAARAVAFALQGKGVGHIIVSNRTEMRGKDLAADLVRLGVSCGVAPFPPRPEDLAGADLVVNTTSLGMTGQPPFEMDFKGLRPHALAADIVYNPLETVFLAGARAQGLATVGGLGMLLHQARAGFKLWFGRDPDVTAEQRTLLEGMMKP